MIPGKHNTPKTFILSNQNVLTLLYYIMYYKFHNNINLYYMSSVFPVATDVVYSESRVICVFTNVIIHYYKLHVQCQWRSNDVRGGGSQKGVLLYYFISHYTLFQKLYSEYINYYVEYWNNTLLYFIYNDIVCKSYVTLWHFCIFYYVSL